MLEGLEISIIPFSKSLANRKFNGRFESEFFLKKYEIVFSLLERNKIEELGNLVYLTDGEHGNAITSSTGFAKYYGARNVLNGILNENNVEFISEEHHNKIKKSKLQVNDVLISCVGANIGYASIVPNYIGEANIVRNVALIRTVDKRVLNHYLLAYFISDIGKTLFNRMATGNAQPLVSLDYIKTIPVFIPSLDFQRQVETTIEKSKESLINSKILYTQAENILLEELGLAHWQPTIKNNNTKTLQESFLQSGRIDAEYYQPKYDEIESIIKRGSYKKISEIRAINYRGFQPVYIEGGEIDVINSKHILDTTLDYDNFEKTCLEEWNNKERAKIFKGDILTYTTGANIGRTQTYLIDKPAFGSNHVNIIRLKEQNPIYVGFVINSIIGRLQTEKYCAGSAQLELYPKDLDEFLIPILPPKTQTTISQKIQESFALQAQSKQLLQAAKTAVEIAIEQGEKEALKYLKTNING